MTRLLAVVGVLTLACDVSAFQFGRPPQPKVAPSKGEEAKRLTEEVESLEAHLVTKKAYILAAQVAVRAAELTLDRAGKLGGPLDEAKLAVDAAKAQVMIREAEANEVAVKIRHAKRRAEDVQKAELAGLEPLIRAPRTAHELARLTEQIAIATAELDKANKEVARLEVLAKQGVVAPADLAAARDKQTELRTAISSLEEKLKR